MVTRHVSHLRVDVYDAHLSRPNDGPNRVQLRPVQVVLELAELEILVVRDVRFHQISAHEVVLLPVLLPVSDGAGRVREGRGEPLRVVVDDARLEGPPPDALRAHQHECLALEGRGSTHLFVEQKLRLVELGVGL